MPVTIKKCNLCHAELRVSDEAQVVECQVCGSINSYGYSRSNQDDTYTKGAPSNKNTGVMPNIQNHQQQPFSAPPTQGQAQLHVLLGGTKQPGSLYFLDTNSPFQQPPQALPRYSPPLAKINSFVPQVSQSSQVSIRTLRTNYTSFQQLSPNSLSLQSSLPPVKTKQTSSLHIPERIINNFFQQPQQTTSPQGSPRPSYNNISYQQPFRASSPPDQNEVNDYSWQPQNTQTPQGSPRPLYTNISHQQPFQTSSPPGQLKFNEFSWQPQQIPSAQRSPRPYSSTPYQQPLTSSPPSAENTKNSFEYPQEASSPQGSPRLANSNTSYQPPQQSSPPSIQENINSLSKLPHQTSSPKGSTDSSYSNTSNQQPIQSSAQELPHQPQTSSPRGAPPHPSRFSSFLRPRVGQTPPQGSSPPAHNDENNQKISQPSSQISSPRSREDNNGHNQISTSSPPPIQENINSLSKLPHQTSSPKGSPDSSYGNTSNQQPMQSSPQELPHQPQTSSPQGASPRPSRFSSFLRPRVALQTPPQGSSPLAHNDENNQKLSQPSSQISSPRSREGNNVQKQISTPPSREANNGFSQKPLLASPQMSASQVPPLLQAPRLPANNNDQNHQKSVSDTKPVSSSVALKPPVTVEQQIRYGTNQGTSGKIATANSQSADHQNPRNREAFGGNLTGGPTNYINKSVADADDDPHYTKRRLKEFREQLQT